jgi:hypothetical protein
LPGYRIEEAVDEERAGFLIHLVFDGLAAERHFDHDVDVVRRVLSNLDRVKAHRAVLRNEA